MSEVLKLSVKYHKKKESLKDSFVNSLAKILIRKREEAEVCEETILDLTQRKEEALAVIGEIREIEAKEGL